LTNPLERLPPHRVIHGFMPGDEAARLAEWAIANEASFEPAGLGREGRVDTAMRNSLMLRGDVDRSWKAPLREQMRALLPEWCAQLGLETFEASAIELDLIAYNDGAFYRRHIDTAQPNRDRPGGGPPPMGDRIVTAVFYFHAEPKGFEGGDLRLYALGRSADGTVRQADLPPVHNSMTVFPSWAPHEVLPVRCPSGAFRDSRFAINCWFRRAR
jgi:SM-20-related protein